MTRTRYVQMAYAGQNFDMSVPTTIGSARGTSTQAELMELAERFHDLHQADRGFSFRQQEPTVRGVRITALGRTPKPPDLAELGTRRRGRRPRTGSRPCTSATASSTRPSTTAPRLGPGSAIDGPGPGRGAVHRRGGAARGAP